LAFVDEMADQPVDLNFRQTEDHVVGGDRHIGHAQQTQ
jgi:hypothetical protein